MKLKPGVSYILVTAFLYVLCMLALSFLIPPVDSASASMPEPCSLSSDFEHGGPVNEHPTEND